MVSDHSMNKITYELKRILLILNNCGKTDMCQVCNSYDNRIIWKTSYLFTSVFNLENYANIKDLSFQSKHQRGFFKPQVVMLQKFERKDLS